MIEHFQLRKPLLNTIRIPKGKKYKIWKKTYCTLKKENNNAYECFNI